MKSRKMSFSVGKEVNSEEILLHEFQTLDEAEIYLNSALVDNEDADITRFFISIIYRDESEAEDEVEMFSAIDVVI